MKWMALTLGATVTALVATGCSAYKDRLAEGAMKGGDAQYDENGDLYQLYEYYPDHEVYRSVYGGTWHWRSDLDVWHRSAHLPEQFDVASAHHELIELATAQPWHQHPIVVRQYPSIHTLRANAAAIQDDHYEDVTGETAFANVPTNDD